MSEQLIELIKMYMRVTLASEMKDMPLRDTLGECNECGECLWYPDRIWNNQEDR